MGRKRNPYLPLYTRDILSSPRCRALSEAAAGVYLFLLCRLNEPPVPGAYRLRDWDPHPTWQRSKTQQCLATADKQARLQYFAYMLAKNDLPWKQAGILAGLQELYRYGIIVVEGDMLVQPRMFKDNGFELPDIDNDGDPVGTILDDPTSGSMALRGDDDFTQNNGANNGTFSGTQKGTKKVQKKVPVSHAGASHDENEYENMSVNNNINSIGNKGGAGGKGGPQFDDFWNLYDKKTSKNGARQYSMKQWYNLSQEERQAAMDFLPQYVAATPVKQYRMSPSSYLTYKAWRVVVIRDGVVVQGINAKGECVPADDKTPLNTPDEQGEGQKGGFKREKKSGTGNLLSDAQKRADSPKNGSDGQKLPVADQPPTLREIQDYMQQRGEGGEPFRHITAEQFYDEGCMSGWTIRGGQPLYSWQARLRSLEGYRRKNGEPAVTEEGYVAYRDGKLIGTLAVRQQPQGGPQGRVQAQPKPGDPVGATPTAKGKYKNKW